MIMIALLMTAAAILIPVCCYFLFIKRKTTRSSSNEDNKADGNSQTSSSSDAYIADELPDEETYEVFLSFQGEDTRKEFTDHLYTRLKNARVWVFRDDDALPIGEEIRPELDKAIKSSKISIPIISPNYASSEWCLNELSLILKCKESIGQVVLPIFYQAKPSSIKKQTDTFEEAFRLHEKKYGSDSETVKQWRNALTKVASFKGFELSKTTGGYEGKLVEKIIAKVLNELKKDTLTVPDYLVGVDDHKENILKLVKSENSNDVQVIVIHGMGGVGETTLAKIVYNELAAEFENCCFLESIREYLLAHCPEDLQKKLISNILGQQWLDQILHVDDGIKIIKDRVKQKEVLILFDDVDHPNQLNALARERNWFKSGSILIITTRNKDIMNRWEGVLFYELNDLDFSLSFLLFCKHAFQRGKCPRKFNTIAKSIVSTTGGLPLAIEIIACSLHGKSKDSWKGTFKKLQDISHAGVQEKLRISYDTLDHWQKQIFLDIACLSIQERMDFAFHMWNSCKFYPQEGIEKLTSLSLIKVRDEKHIIIHDQLRDLGRAIVREDAFYMRGNYSRLWNNDEGLEVIRGMQGSTNIQALSLACNPGISIKDRDFTSEQFKSLTSLRFLRLKRANLVGDFKNLLLDLRWLQWECYGASVSPPVNFHPTKLVVLELSGSGITEQWEGWAQIELVKKLKVLKLESCDKLKSTPYFSAFKKLEILILRRCDNILRIHPSICNLNKTLLTLDIRGCRKIEELPTEMGEMEELRQLLVDRTSVSTIPISEGYMTNLVNLSATHCENLGHLPDSMGSLVNLVNLSFDSCWKLTKLPGSIGKLKSLSQLNLKGSPIMELPSSIGDLDNLKVLDISGTRIERLPVTIGRLRNLQQFNAVSLIKLIEVPEEIKELRSLQILNLECCDKLKSMANLHCNLTSLNFSGRSMETIPNLTGLSNLKKLTYHDEFKRRSRVFNISSLNSLEYLRISGSNEPDNIIENIELILELPSSLKEVYLINCQTLRTLPSLSNCNMLSSLEIGGCSSLSKLGNMGDAMTSCKLTQCDAVESFPHLLTAKNLNSLEVKKCKNLMTIQGLDDVKCLKALTIHECPSLERLGDLSHLKMLTTLVLLDCERLGDFDCIDKLSSLQTLEIVGCNPKNRLLDLSRLNNLKILNLEQFEILVTMLQKQKYLKDLKISFCKSLEKLPDISLFAILKRVFFSNCEKLTAINGLKKHNHLEELRISCCNSLDKLPDISLFPSLEKLDVDRCEKLIEIKGLKGHANLRTLKISHCNLLSRLPDISLLTRLEEMHVEECEKLTEIKGLKEQNHLTSLAIFRCNSLDNLPDLSLFAKLRKVIGKGCEKLTVIKGLPKYLTTLDICGCTSLVNIPDFSGCQCFQELRAEGCDKLTEIRGLENLKNFHFLAIFGCKSLRVLPDLPAHCIFNKQIDEEVEELLIVREDLRRLLMRRNRR